MVDTDQPRRPRLAEDAGGRRPRPYADAPCLPEGAVVDVRQLVSGTVYELEIGPGRGGFVFERAAAEPEVALIGLEVRRKWAQIVDERLAKRGLSGRARVFAEDAKHALGRLGPAEVLARVFVHFPDPWWKKRHTKRLLLNAALLDEVARLLAPQGELFVQTDVADRAVQVEDLVLGHPAFVPAGDAHGSPRLSDNPYGAQSPRERRAVEDGLPIHRLRFRRR
jgi:tRNA (guanine-N7-)-methyltransferase